MSIKIHGLMLMGLALAALGGCGVVGVGTGNFNDAVPSGTIIAQGNLSGMNAHDVEGNVAVYRSTCGASSCKYVLRLSNLSAPNVSLLIIPAVNGTVTPATITLRGPSGTQNYSFTGSSSSVTWNYIILRPTTAGSRTDQDYAQATLQTVIPQ